MSLSIYGKVLPDVDIKLICIIFLLMNYSMVRVLQLRDSPYNEYFSCKSNSLINNGLLARLTSLLVVQASVHQMETEAVMIANGAIYSFTFLYLKLMCFCL